jgi:Xaa-Pro aminopeptidase
MDAIDPPLLIRSNTAMDSDLRYLLGMSVPDDIAVVFDGKSTTALANALEIGRLKTMSPSVRVVPMDTPGQPKGGDSIDGVCRFLRELGLDRVSVKKNCPIHLADGLRTRGIAITVVDFSILPKRLIKSEAEIVEIRRAAEIVGAAFVAAEKILSDAGVNGSGELVHGGDVLTSDVLRAKIDNCCYGLGCLAEDTIVAGGTDACNPHEIGHGPLRANEFIVVDLFPRLRTSGYYADVSRTFFKGKPSAERMAMYDAVECAHDMAIGRIRGGMPVADALAATLKFFDGRGFPSSRTASPPHGMFHSLGHGLGLDVHEPPTIGTGTDFLETGMVVTVEPGLYYPGIGGVRIEDDILVGEGSCEILTPIPHHWIIE